MKYNLKEIFEQQIQLDTHIHQNKKVTYQLVYEHLKLALIVELAELANEVRSFKFWSHKQSSPDNIVLEEYVDGIHFITSICIHFNLDDYVFELPNNILAEKDKKTLTRKFTQLLTEVADINNSTTAKAWYQEYLMFGFILGFKIEQILDAYITKNLVNHKRQDENY